MLEFLFHLLPLFFLVVLLLSGFHGSLGMSDVRGALLVSGAALDVRGIEEPDVPVLVLKELCLHLQDLILIDLLNVMSHLVTLLESEMLIVMLGTTFK
jgi:hypothetical protein